MTVIDYSDHDEAPPLETVYEHVDNGIAWLDHYGPDRWWDRIDVDSLDLDQPDACVLGQVYAPEAHEAGILDGYKYAVVFQDFLRSADGHRDEVWEHGFLGYLMDESNMLLSVWTDRLTALKEERRPRDPMDRLTILANSNVSRGKFAAAAVHAALNLYGIDHGPVIVLGAKPSAIEEQCDLVVRDAGRTEVEPGTITAGIREVR